MRSPHRSVILSKFLRGLAAHIPPKYISLRILLSNNDYSLKYRVTVKYVLSVRPNIYNISLTITFILYFNAFPMK